MAEAKAGYRNLKKIDEKKGNNDELLGLEIKWNKLKESLNYILAESYNNPKLKKEIIDEGIELEKLENEYKKNSTDESIKKLYIESKDKFINKLIKNKADFEEVIPSLVYQPATVNGGEWGEWGDDDSDSDDDLFVGGRKKRSSKRKSKSLKHKNKSKNKTKSKGKKRSSKRKTKSKRKKRSSKRKTKSKSKHKK